MSFYDDSHPKPSVVKGNPGHHAYCHSLNSVDDGGRLLVHLLSDDFDNSIDLWYVYVDFPAAEPHTRSVICYADKSFPNGTVLLFDEATQKGIKYEDSAGFIRWFVDDSRIQQVMVKEEYRRKRVSTKLFSVADLLIIADPSWNGKHLNGGDITTSDGDKLRAAWSQSTRLTQKQGSVESKPTDQGAD